MMLNTSSMSEPLGEFMNRSLLCTRACLFTRQLVPDNSLKILNECDDNSSENTATDISQAMIMMFIVTIFRGEDPSKIHTGGYTK